MTTYKPKIPRLPYSLLMYLQKHNIQSFDYESILSDDTTPWKERQLHGMVNRLIRSGHVIKRNNLIDCRKLMFFIV